MHESGMRRASFNKVQIPPGDPRGKGMFRCPHSPPACATHPPCLFFSLLFFLFLSFFLEHCLKEWIKPVRAWVDVVMFMAPIAWWLFYDVCVLASVMPWCLHCDVVIWGGQGHAYITYTYPIRGMKCTYKSYECCMPRACVWGPWSHKQVLLRSKCTITRPGMKCLGVPCKPNSLPDWSALQDPSQFSIKRNGLCWPKKCASLACIFRKVFLARRREAPASLELVAFPVGVEVGTEPSPQWCDVAVLLSKRKETSFAACRMKPSPRRPACSAPAGPRPGAAGAKAEWPERPGGTAMQPGAGGHCVSSEGKSFLGNTLTTWSSQTCKRQYFFYFLGFF